MAPANATTWNGLCRYRHNPFYALTAGIDTTVIALWLGHESIETTQVYLHADMTMKEKAVARTTPTGTRPGRYKPPDDDLMTFLRNL